MCKFCESQWLSYDLQPPADHYNIYLVEDHEGNCVPALWENRQFTTELMPFGHVQKWAKITHWIGNQDGIIGFVALQKFFFYEEMFEDDPIFELQVSDGSEENPPT